MNEKYLVFQHELACGLPLNEREEPHMLGCVMCFEYLQTRRRLQKRVPCVGRNLLEGQP